jgi:prevent-host-death family protein
MKRIALSEARDCLSRLVNEVAHGSERVILESHGRAKAAIVAIRDLERLEAEGLGEDRESAAMLRWLEDAHRHLAIAKTAGNASLEALLDVREGVVAEEADLYRRERRPQARRRRKG